MPTHSVVPYRIGLRKKGNKRKYWGLKDLQNQDSSLPDDNILDSIANFLDKYKKSPVDDGDLEKTFRVEKFNRDGDVIDGIIRSGGYGYRTILRDIYTNVEEDKVESQAEELPFYFVISLPETKRGSTYENNEILWIAFQQINGGGTKTLFYKYLNEYLIKSGTSSQLEINPVFSGEVLEEVLSSDRIKEIEFRMSETPDDVEEKYHLLEGMSELEQRSQAFALKPDYGGSFERFRAMTRKIKNMDRSFAEVVDDSVEDLKVRVENENAGTQTIDVLEDEISMKRTLKPRELRFDGGLPTTKSMAKRSRETINSIDSAGIVKDISTDTLL